MSRTVLTSLSCLGAPNKYRQNGGTTRASHPEPDRPTGCLEPDELPAPADGERRPRWRPSWRHRTRLNTRLPAGGRHQSASAGATKLSSSWPCDESTATTGPTPSPHPSRARPAGWRELWRATGREPTRPYGAPKPPLCRPSPAKGHYGASLGATKIASASSASSNVRFVLRGLTRGALRFYRLPHWRER
jgi:hypothetical protein